MAAPRIAASRRHPKRKQRDNMFKKSLALFGLAMVLVWTASAQDAKAVISNASRAMGVDTLKTVQYSATGMDFALGQAPNRSEERRVGKECRL